jgi:hypothetical protein
VVTPAPKRRWSFSLRTLFVVVTVFGIGCGWLLSQVKLVHERERLSAAQVGWYRSTSYPAPIPWAWRFMGAVPVEAIALPEERFTEEDALRYGNAFPEAEVTREPERQCFSPTEIGRRFRKQRARARAASGEVDPKDWAGPRTRPIPSPAR